MLCTKRNDPISESNRVVFFFALFLAGVALCLRVPEIWRRVFDPDEFEHFHAAFCLWSGMVPYRDFFEHHPPLFWLVLQPLFFLGENPFVILVAGRLLMCLGLLGILFVTFDLAKVISGKFVGTISVVFLGCTTMFVTKSIEIRPDIPEVLLWLISVRFVLSGCQRKRDTLFFWAGLFSGLSGLCSQKVILGVFGLIGALIARGVWEPAPGARRRLFRSIVIFSCGFLLPFSVTICVLFFLDGAGSFLYRCFVFNALWKIRISPMPVCLEFIRQNPLICSLGCTAVLMQLGSVGKSFEKAILLGAVVGVLFGIALIPVVQRQYLLLLFPLWSIFAAEWFVSRIVGTDTADRKVWDFVLAGFLGISVAFGSPRIHGRSDTFAALWLLVLALVLISVRIRLGWVRILLSLLVVSLAGFLTPLGNFGMVFWAAALVYLAVIRFVRGREALLITLLVGIIAFPLSKALRHDYVGNVTQLEYIDIVMEETNPDDTVFDGWSGYGVFRPHAYYYFFLHTEIRAMLNQDERGKDVVEALRLRNPKIIIYDEHVQRLSGEVNEYVQKYYRPMGLGHLYRRIDGGGVVSIRANSYD